MPGDMALLARRHRALGRHSPLMYDRPLHLVRGKGVWVEDVHGRRYLDAYNNVPHVGHCHPDVVEAICRQSDTLNIHTRYLHDSVVQYAERLTATSDPSLSVAMLTCTGTEANELALRIARFASGGTGMIVSSFSYHGNSATLAAVTTALPAPEAFAPHARSVAIPDLNHSQRHPAQLAQDYADKVAEAVRSLKAAGIKPAAILFDPIFSTEGLPKLPKGFLEQAVAHVREAGGLFIADEVQGGLGRTGDHMWSHQAYGIVPDLVTLGKPLGNGHPLAGVITRPDLLEAFASSALYFNTFAGNPVSAAAGLAVLDVIEREKLVENANLVGAFLQKGLVRLAGKHQLIGSVRGSGLFFGLELLLDRRPAAHETKRLVNVMRENGVLINRIGPHDNILKMRPPMPFSIANAELLLSTLDNALASL
ncbi:aminotransferase class III-fold pyridoxal phosphate-dependent enzyme [Bradyrhizobium sp. 24]|uniref:aspartate aminotransferase family protein n=1 Tax=unclassified Bradyrhizobium TaxID=2631580 RepID=UPI001FF758A0|nr:MULTISPECIES: aminotransferase class III-fold pyridoxal phosphate-dependent enzyme [unclassified Bradyrhizobium]MCK1297395.1 aminotransferase class III-fold pyridoxal phosphate-dependent enzyme [Bradyrhizobium sp. 37]MCK1377634.1 aminotransferase class III-fold pyridoxal phosphate-dependent enzyme [Bradyrhizobium sp. 24]MCK1769123.1 aminotransferase class III-fold pyridoxal phosphate-dependent enzyme [Bradyrhizobium sp. 134]